MLQLFQPLSVTNSEQLQIPKIIIMLAPSGILGVVATLVLLAAPASARIWAGSVDLDVACQEQYDNGSEYAILTGSDAYGWICYNPKTGSSGRVDVDVYCAHTYGGNAYADPQGGGPYDWGCYFP